MAKQIGEIRITGTVAGVTFYKMDGQYYARKKSSLLGKRVKTDPKFRRTMEWAGRLARGSQLASRVYRSLPREERVYALFCTLKSAAIRELKEGRSEEEVLMSLESIVGSLESEVSSREQPRVSNAGTVLKAASTGQSHLWVDVEGKLLCRQPIGVYGQVFGKPEHGWGFASLSVLNHKDSKARRGTKTIADYADLNAGCADLKADYQDWKEENRTTDYTD